MIRWLLALWLALAGAAFGQEDEGDPTALAHLKAAEAALNQGDFDGALEELAVSLEIYRALGDARSEVHTLRSFAQVVGFSGQCEAELGWLEQAYEVARAAGLHDKAGEALLDASNAHLRCGQIDAARGAADQALALSEAEALPVVRARALMTQATLLGSLNLDPERRAALLREALLLCEEHEQALMGALIRRNLAELEVDAGRYAEAAVLLDEAIPVLRTTGAPQNLPTALAHRAHVAFMVGDFGRAIELTDEALALSRRMQNAAGHLNVLYTSVQLYAWLGDYSTATALSEEALAVSEAADIPVAVCHVRLQREMLRYWQSPMDRASKQQHAEVCQDIADCYAQIGYRYGQITAQRRVAVMWNHLDDPRAAPLLEELVEQAEDIGDPVQETSVLRMLAEHNSAPLHDEPSWQRALAAADRSGNAHSKITTTLNWLDTVPPDKLRTPQALARLRDLPDLLDDDAATYGRDNEQIEDYHVLHRPGLHEAALTLYEEGFDDAAFRLLASMQAPGLRAQVAMRRWLETAEADEQIRWQSLVDTTPGLDVLRTDLLHGLDPDEQVLRTRQAAFFRLVTELTEDTTLLRTPSLREVQAALAEQAYRSARPPLLLAFHLGEEHLLVQVIEPDSYALVLLWGAAPQVRADALLVSEAMEELSTLPPAARELGLSFFPDDAIYRLFFTLIEEPSWSRLSKDRPLFIAPDGVLQSVPFAALRTRDPRRATAWLIERHPIAVLPSVSWLVVQRPPPERLKSEHRSLLMGATAVPGSPRLPYGDAELDTVRGHLAALGEVQVACDQGCAAPPSAATWAAEAPGAAIVHVVAHGEARSHPWLDERSGGTLAHLQLVDAEGRPERLWEHRVETTLLDADLVTLSACRTFAADSWELEGALGLSRALLAAGARSVLSTHWAVDDQATAALMDRFYAELVAARTAEETPIAWKARALRSAQLELLSRPETAHPLYWAGFVLVGAAD
ncbi:MAG: CHAT domain-containing protein [Alphaproteobacteria bacterium]|nr:CHAT domain-containing protein [Alphaproteobacteria bacterium]